MSYQLVSGFSSQFASFPPLLQVLVATTVASNLPQLTTSAIFNHWSLMSGFISMKDSWRFKEIKRLELNKCQTSQFWVETKWIRKRYDTLSFVLDSAHAKFDAYVSNIVRTWTFTFLAFYQDLLKIKPKQQQQQSATYKFGQHLLLQEP